MRLLMLMASALRAAMSLEIDSTCTPQAASDSHINNNKRGISESVMGDCI